MRYSKKQYETVGKLLVETLYHQRTNQSLLEEVSKSVGQDNGLYRNIDQFVRNIDKMIVTQQYTWNLPYGWIVNIYPHLTKSDKPKFIAAMTFMVEYYRRNYNIPFNKTRAFLNSVNQG